MLRDVLSDLTRTRLLPVAAVLALGAVALPVVVLRPQAEQPSAPAAVAAATAPQGGTRAAAAGPGEVRPPRPDVGQTRNPFRPLHELRDGGGDGAGGPGEATGDGAGGLTTGDDVLVAATGGDGSTDSAGTLTGGGGGGATDMPPTDDLVPLERIDAARDERRTSPARAPFTYVVDVLLSGDGRRRRVEGAERMQMLPGPRNPLLVYLGVTASRRTAVFMVRSDVRHAGEGRCLPSPEVCTFLMLRTDPRHDEHFFRDADDERYTLRLRAINRVAANLRTGPVVETDILPAAPGLVDDEGALEDDAGGTAGGDERGERSGGAAAPGD